MSVISIRLNAAQAKRVDDELRLLLGRIKDYQPLNEKLARYMKADTKSRISRYKVSPDGTAWEPLSEVTENLRARISVVSDKHSDLMHLPGNILVDSGELLKGIEIGSVGRKQFEIRSTSDHSSLMQYGIRRTSGMIPNKQVPARPFLGFSEANRAFIRKRVIDYLMNGRT